MKPALHLNNYCFKIKCNTPCSNILNTVTYLTNKRNKGGF